VVSLFGAKNRSEGSHVGWIDNELVREEVKEAGISVCEYLCVFSCANESNSVRTAKVTQIPTDTNDNDNNDQSSGSDGGNF
jgi:hypothetical protein